jgi:hypothetical protein
MILWQLAPQLHKGLDWQIAVAEAALEYAVARGARLGRVLRCGVAANGAAGREGLPGVWGWGPGVRSVASLMRAGAVTALLP